MAPNSTHISLPSNKSTPSKRRIQSINTTNSADLTEETFTIIQYAIYSLLGRSTISSPEVAIRFRELVNGILNQHDVYSSFCVNLHLSPVNFERDFHGVAESIFEDGQMNWGRLIALVGFSVKAAEYFRSCGENQDDIVVEITSNFIVHKAETWIVNRGGWKDVVAHFSNTKHDSGQFAARNDGWFKGMLMTATATIGLGALSLFAVTCN